MITIGLTGQTGAGKSTFADYLRRKYGFVHIDTDKISREVIKTKTAELAAMFGSDVLNPDGTPNRKMIAKRAFSSKENTDALNRIMHPAIMQTVEKMISDAEKNGAVGAIVDGAALIESGSINAFDTSVCVVADREVRKRRIIERDNLSEEDAETRLNGQKDDSFYISNTEHKTVNNSLAELEKQADELMKKYNIYPVKEEK